MNSLQFLSAWELVQDEAVACKALEFLPWPVCDVLFKVAFWNHKVVFLFNLVKMWPYSDLRIRKLLQTCQIPHDPPSSNCPDCLWTLPCVEFDKNVFNAIIQGVMINIRKTIHHGSQQLPRRRLRRVDITGFLTNEFDWNIHFMNMWANSVIQMQSCILPHQNIPVPQSQGMGQVTEASLHTKIPKEACIYLLVDLQVSIEAKEFLIKTFQRNTNSPLRLICQDIWNANLSAQAMAEFLNLLDPMSLRRVDLGLGIEDLMETSYCQTQIGRLYNLQSLRLCYLDLNQQSWLSPRKKAHFDNFANKINKLKHLKEISVCHFHISGQLEYMLSGIQGPLESVELSFCFLVKEDFDYLTESCHGSNLIKLDLSGTNLTNKLNSFLRLLEETSNKLICLNMTKCRLQDTHFSDIMPYLCKCKNLSHLGLFGNPLSVKSLRILWEQLQRKVINLKVVSLPAFLENSFQQGPSPVTSEALTICEDLSQVFFIPRKPMHFAFDICDYFDIR